VYTLDAAQNPKLGGRPFLEHKPLQNEVRIHITGRQGVAHRLGHDYLGHMKFLSPEEILREFEKFLKLGQTQQGIILRCLKERLHIWAYVEYFRWNRDVRTSRLSYEWELSLRGFEYTDEGDFTSDFTDKMREWGDTINELTAVAAVAAQTIENARNLVSRNLSAVLDPLSRMASQLEEVSGQLRGIGQDIWRILDQGLEVIADFKRMVFTFKDDFFGVADDFKTGMDRLGDTWEGIAGKHARGPDVSTAADAYGAAVNFIRVAVEDLEHAMEVAKGFEGEVKLLRPKEPRRGLLNDERGVAGLAEFISPIKTGSLPLDNQNFRSIVLGPGEDLRDVALVVFGSRDAWGIIADINGWLSATLKENGARPVAGDVVLVPSPDQPSDIQKKAVGMGHDMQVEKSGDVEFENLLSGDDNIAQWITNLCKTSVGAIGASSQFGWVGNSTESVSDERVATYLAATLREQLIRDSRISDITSMSIDIEGDMVAIVLTVLLSDETTLSLTVPVGG
tara:strand:+ start:2043 stop:3566 length:1524 start_codon:yes stop_codon:yes gene_type:complete